MTVEELMVELEYLDPEAEVRLAIQPNYPLEYTLSQIAEVNLSKDCWDDPDYVVEGEPKDDDPDYTVEESVVVYLGVGNQIGYLPEQAAQALGW